MKLLKYIFRTAVFSSIFFAAYSCESLYESEQDCSTKIKFEFRKHRQALQSVNGNAADVFYSAVSSVHLFVYDAENGELVLDRYAGTDELKTESELNIGSGSEKCYLPLDLLPGKYRLVAWCGLGADDSNNAFALGGASRAAQKYDECSVKLSSAGHPVNNEKYDALFQGYAEVSIDNSGMTVPVELTKNTNDIAVWVQHTTASFGNGDYEVVYTDANGSMRFEDNTLANSDVLEYRAHTTSLLQAETEYNGEPVEAGALIAHISTSRLMASRQNDARLEVRNRAGATVFSIPFIKYLLEMQTFTTNGQYYLDCEDTYHCSFYLSGGNSGEGGEPGDEGELWFPARIIINNWVRVPDQTGNI